MKIVVIIPTYNEEDIIGKLIEQLEAEFKNINNHNLHILVVDGNSPDNTAEIVKVKQHLYKNIDLIIEKKKEGIGMAYIKGMNYAMKGLGAEALIEFDGDFQHDPKDIKRLIQEFDKGYDYIIGSRYVKGGNISKEWSFYRKFLSRFGSLFIKYALSFPVNDCTSGLKLSRVQNFTEKLPLDAKRVLSKRHACGIHFLYEMIKLGAKVKEIPIQFSDRKSGSSKNSFKDIFEFLKVVLGLFLKSKIK